MADRSPHKADEGAHQEWLTFPGGELEGECPRTLCPACRERLGRAAAARMQVRRSRLLCFQCYRAELDRQKRLRAAGRLDTASELRFQFVLPLEPVNRPRLEMLKAEYAAARATGQIGRSSPSTPSSVNRFAERRRRAQIAARHALQSIAAGLRMQKVESGERERITSAAIRVARLQLPESWLPFVVSQ